MEKKAKKKSSFFSSVNYKIIHWGLLLIVLINGYLVWTFERDRKPRVVRETVTVVTNVVHVVTNFIGSAGASFGTNGVAGVNAPTRPNDPAFEIEIPFRYMLVAGRRLIELGGRYFSEGSPTSYGRIARIYPERVALDNGYFLKCKGFEDRWSYDDHPNRTEELRRRRQEKDEPDPPVIIRHTYNADGYYNRGNYYDD